MAVESESSTDPQEMIVVTHLVAAWNEFLKLPCVHTSESIEFMSAIHRLEGIIALRIASRVHPEVWQCDSRKLAPLTTPTEPRDYR